MSALWLLFFIVALLHHYPLLWQTAILVVVLVALVLLALPLQRPLPNRGVLCLLLCLTL